MPEMYVYSFFFFLSLLFLSFSFYIFYIFLYLFMFMCSLRVQTLLVEKRIRFPQDLSLVLYVHFRIFYFCIIELWVLVNLKYRKRKKNAPWRIYSGASKKIFLNIFFLLLHKTKMIILMTTNDKCSNNLFKYQTVLTINKKITR